jgi:DNA-binding transcriptional LysR family regulator
MTLNEIEAFVAVAETGSVNRAAQRLHLTQPAMSRRLQKFEAALGVATLLDRSTKPPVLTPTGRKVLVHCRLVLRAMVELKASSSKANEPAGDLRIGVAHGLGDVVLGAPLDDLVQRFPGVRLQVSANWTTRLIDEIRSGALDCAIGLITHEHAVPPGIQVASLGPERIVVVTARDAKPLTKRKGGTSLLDLADLGWILNPVGCGCRAALERACDRVKASMRISAEVFGEDLQLSAIVRRGGLGLVPHRQLEHSPHRKRLRIVTVSDFTLQATIAVLHGSSLGPVRVAVERLKAQVADRLNK